MQAHRENRPAAPTAASTAVRPLLQGPPRDGRVLAAFPSAVYVEVPQAETRVVALVTPSAVRLPVAVVLGGSAPGPLASACIGGHAVVGGGKIRVGALRAQVARWWDPMPKLDAVSPTTLHQRLTELRRLLDRASTRPGLADHEAGRVLAQACEQGDIPGTVEAANRVVGLGPGLTPSGDDMVAGLLLSLKLLGGAVTATFVDVLGAAVTRDIYTRTTAVAATLLQCAVRGQATAEVGAVLTALAGHGRLEPPMRQLLSVGHTSGADLGWGLYTGGLACLRTTEVCPQNRPTDRTNRTLEGQKWGQT